jgi:sugar transferase EpsL
VTLYRRFGKRAVDLAGAALGLLATAPIALVVALLVRLRLGRPVLYRQLRPGLGGRPFEIRKFRTMRDAADAAGRPLPDAERLTRLGRWLRRTSLDELPELVNVLRGEMSLVGPRPLLIEYLPRYDAEQARRHEVRPGITGWAQVHGRNAVGWEERFRLDVWYVDHLSLSLDLRILLRSVGQVLRGRGVSAAGHATMPRFGEGGIPAAGKGGAEPGGPGAEAPAGEPPAEERASTRGKGRGSR